jgi:tetratricopeptide (TPR) repeat protein
MGIPLRSLITTTDFTYRLASLKERTKDLFRFWQVHSPHYTDHGESHVEAVEKDLDELIPDDIKTEMNEYEIFLLLSGVLLHDIGIMCATQTEEENQKIRENHHERSRQYVIDNLKGLLNCPERYVVGEICFAHRDSVPLAKIEKVKTIRHSLIGNKEVRLQFLAGLLRLADSCDICHTRTSEDLVIISKPSDESAFFHALHERVSGIRFDAKDKIIYIDLNVASSKEKNTCMKYIINSVQRSLYSVRDCLIRNDVTYIDVIPKFSITKTITSELTVPKREKKETTLASLKESFKLTRKALSLYNKKNYRESLEYCDKGLKINSKNAFLWLIRALVCSDSGDTEGASVSFQKCLELEPENATYWTNAGHFYGEFLLDIEKSFKCLEKAYQIRPNETIYILNYAEALVTIGKTQEGYNLATRYWKESNDIVHAFNASFIRMYSLFLMGKRNEGLKELSNLFLFFKTSPPSFKTNNRWTYNKIRKYISESKLDDDVKKILADIIDLAELKLSIEDFEKRLKKGVAAHYRSNNSEKASENF